MMRTLLLMRIPLLSLLAVSCANQWQSRPADRPLSLEERAAYDITVTDSTLAAALSAAGFRVVKRPTHTVELEAIVSMAGGQEVVTLRSDGFFIDEVRAPAGDVDALVRAVASSQALKTFVHNSGTPQHALDGM
jgi:hypothetical protein